jgi:hypothetical protein
MNRNLLEGTFSEWIRKNLRSSWNGLIVIDIDYILKIGKKFYIIEEKNKLDLRFTISQQIVFDMIDKLNKQQNNDSYGGIFLVNIITYSNIVNYNFENLIVKYSNPLDGKSFRIEKFSGITDDIQYLWDCKSPKSNPSRATNNERSGYRGSVLEQVLRNIYYIRGIWIFLDYCHGWFRLIKFVENIDKLNSQDLNFLKEIDTIFSFWNNVNLQKGKVKNPKSGAVYEYQGLYLLAFKGGNSPATSNDIYLQNINGKRCVRCNEELLKKFLNFEISLI